MGLRDGAVEQRIMAGSDVVLTEGGVVERVRHHPSARLDPAIAEWVSRQLG